MPATNYKKMQVVVLVRQVVRTLLVQTRVNNLRRSQQMFTVSHRQAISVLVTRQAVSVLFDTYIKYDTYL